MKIIYLLTFALVFTITVLAQSDLPVTGKISDIQGKKKIYLDAGASDSRKKIQKILEKDKVFELVDNQAQADFILEYKPAKNDQQSALDPDGNKNIAELSAYFFNSDKKKVVAWSKTGSASDKKSDGEKINEASLTTDFLTAYKEAAAQKWASQFKVSGAMQVKLPDDGIQIISVGLIVGKAKSLVVPPYPAAARKDRPSGPINVELVVDIDGKVLAAQAMSGHPALQAAAEAAAKKSTFVPTALNGQKVRVRGILVYYFSAQ